MSTSNWDRRFLALAEHIAQWSRDPSTKVGAVIAEPTHEIISLGFNGLPQRVADTEERLNNRDLKYKMIVHAERNALLFARRDLRGCTLYTWPFPPCAACAGMVIQAGIRRVVAPVLPDHLRERWAEDIALTQEMFAEARVAFVRLEEVQA